jgi:hypothetical protein
MTVRENMNRLEPRQQCEKLAAAVIERAVEDCRLFTAHGILIQGKVNTGHRIFRTKKQFDSIGFQHIRDANPRDAYDLLRFFDSEIKPWLRVAGIRVAARVIKRAVFNGKVNMRGV